MTLLFASLYAFCLLLMFLFSVAQLSLVLLSRRKNKAPDPELPAELPRVAVQLPLYNERYVAERLLRAAAALDWPADRLEIQVLDDSTDATREVVDRVAAELRGNGIGIRVVRRAERTGFKAGALEYGLTQTDAEFLTIFDADFLPQPDFLKRTVGAFADPKIGAVQARWGHINEDYSLLTRLQAFGLNAHFVIEQPGRCEGRSFLNFNGTAGIWRRECIETSGGWSDDTLTEDLDLSYRAQLHGWRIHYTRDVVVPAELPILMPSIKSQQFRWTKGGAETARKHLMSVLRSPMPLRARVLGSVHLLASSIFLVLLVSGLTSLPLVFFDGDSIVTRRLLDICGVLFLGFMAITAFYWVSARRACPEKSARYFFSHYPLFLLVTMGLSLHNGLAVFEGLIGRRSPFVRTPKFNVTEAGDDWSGNEYVSWNVSPLTILEGSLSLVFLTAAVIGVVTSHFWMIPFHLMMAGGMGMVFLFSLRPRLRSGRA